MQNDKLISIGKILDVTFEHYKKYFNDLVRISAWLFLPLFFTILGIIIFDKNPVDNFLMQFENPGTFDYANQTNIFATLYGIFMGIVSILTGGWILASTVQVIQKQKNNQPINANEVSATSWRLMPRYILIFLAKSIAVLSPVLLLAPGVLLTTGNAATLQLAWVSILGIILIALGLVGALIGIIYLAISLQFAEIHFIVKQKETTLGALKASKELVKGRWFKTTLTLFVPYIILAAATIFAVTVLTVASTILSVILLQTQANTLAIASTIGQEVIFTSILALTTPLYILVTYTLYTSLVETKK